MSGTGGSQQETMFVSMRLSVPELKNTACSAMLRSTSVGKPVRPKRNTHSLTRLAA